MERIFDITRVEWGLVVLKNGLMMEVSQFSGDYPFHYWRMFIIPSISPKALVPIEGMMNIKTYLPIIERRFPRKLANLHPQAIF